MYKINHANNSSRSKGAKNELRALKYLQQEGYHILEINYRCHVGEIDIIAKDQDTLVFVEVKFRKTSDQGNPYESVTPSKQRKISKVALHYLTTTIQTTDIPCRFDVISILDNQIQHFKNAFDYI